MFIRWPAFALAGVVIAFVLFKLFVWLLNSSYFTKQLKSVTLPKAETTDEVKEQLLQSRELRDEFVRKNQQKIQKAVDDNQDLKSI